MIPREESLNCIDLGKYYIIQPMFYWWDTKNFKTYIGKKGKPVEESFEYSSDKNTNWYTEKDLKKLLEKVL